MRVDLHNHTILCNHATGSVDDYVKKAIELGIDEFGLKENSIQKIVHNQSLS